ncbi:MAG: NADH-quinone oxidoreductase subunit M [Desertifilum sp.]|nr:NADH-quinone oxidoreductase subunit M [Desertifilum sp.]
MLSALIWLPILGAAGVGFWPNFSKSDFSEQDSARCRTLALGVAIVELVWTLVLGVQFHPEIGGMQWSEFFPWIDALGLTYSLGVDGISFPLIAINSLLTAIAIYSSDRAIQRPRLYYSLILFLCGCVAGAFLAQDLLLFFLFYELELIPLYLLIAIWGGKRRGYAATKFLIYTAISGILLLASFLGLVLLTHAPDFVYNPQLAQALPLSSQIPILVGILLAFGIKTPLVPFHTWLPDAHVEASTPISVLLAGVLLKLGTYGLLRFGLCLLPQAWAFLAPALAVWAVISVLYGALSAIAQTDMKKMVAFSSIAHMGYILLAAAAATPLSLLAAIFQMVSHGLISALLFLLVGVVYVKAGSRDITQLRGLLNPERGLPMIGSLMVLGVMASAGIPGMVGFVSEFLVFRSTYAAFPVQTLLCMVGTGLTAVYFLLLVNQAFFGRLSPLVEDLPPVQWSDRVPAIALAVLIVLLGVQPTWMVRWSEQTTTAVMKVFPQAQVAQVINFSPPSQFP